MNGEYRGSLQKLWNRSDEGSWVYWGSCAVFLKRVLNLEHGFPPEKRPLKRFLRQIAFTRKLDRKIYRTSVLTEMEICPDCTFVQTRVPFSEASLGRLYADYRSNSYNQERIRYEPEYAALASQVGSCDREIQARTIDLTQWLQPWIQGHPVFTMLDYGGADGKFLPLLEGKKSVFEISNIDPAPGIARITKESDLSTYSYIQLAHVLEHVTSPLELTKKAASFLNSSGHLYIEVPQELSDEELNRLRNGDRSIAIPIHEHINRYSAKSVTNLLQSAGLSIVALEPEHVDFGWTAAIVIRALARWP
jgi:Methyltransferase domain